MLEKYFGLIEMTLSFGIFIALCVWELWSLEKTRKRPREEQPRKDQTD